MFEARPHFHADGLFLALFLKILGNIPAVPDAA